MITTEEEKRSLDEKFDKLFQMIADIETECTSNNKKLDNVSTLMKKIDIRINKLDAQMGKITELINRQ